MQSNTASDDILEKVREFVRTPQQGHNCFVIAVEKEGVTNLHPRTNQPCYGELCVYNEYPKEKVHKPGDLHHPMPKGNPVAVGVSLQAPQFQPETQPFIRWMLTESPWAKYYNKHDAFEVVENGKKPAGLLLKNTKTDPTPMLQMLLNIKGLGKPFIPYFFEMTDAGVAGDTAFVLLRHLIGSYKSFPQPLGQDNTDYSFLAKTDLRRWRDGNPYNLTMGHETLYERGAYNRPLVTSIWSGGTARGTEITPDGKIYSLSRDLLNSERIGKKFSIEDAITVFASEVEAFY